MLIIKDEFEQLVFNCLLEFPAKQTYNLLKDLEAQIAERNKPQSEGEETGKE